MKYIVCHMTLNDYSSVRNSSDALAVLKEYRRLPLDHKLKRAFGAALAVVTAESMGGQLHAYSDDYHMTLLVSKWAQKDYPRAVLLKNSIYDWPASVAYWTVTGNNQLIGEDHRLDMRSFDEFIIKATYDRWFDETPICSPVRWAEVARIYEETGLGNKVPNEDNIDEIDKIHEKLLPKFLKIMGVDSVFDIDPSWKPSEKEFFPAYISHITWKAKLPDTGLNQYAFNYIAKPLPTHIPIEVLRNREELSPTQALVWYLVGEENGPNLTYATAASLLGMKNRQEIGTHLKRARDTISKFNQSPKLSGVVRYEYLDEEAPVPIEITSKSAENSGEEGRL